MLRPTIEMSIKWKKSERHAQSAITGSVGRRKPIRCQNGPRAKQGVPVELHFGGINFEIKLLAFCCEHDWGRSCKDNISGVVETQEDASGTEPRAVAKKSLHAQSQSVPRTVGISILDSKSYFESKYFCFICIGPHSVRGPELTETSWKFAFLLTFEWD